MGPAVRPTPLPLATDLTPEPEDIPDAVVWSSDAPRESVIRAREIASEFGVPALQIGGDTERTEREVTTTELGLCMPVDPRRTNPIGFAHHSGEPTLGVLGPADDVSIPGPSRHVAVPVDGVVGPELRGLAGVFDHPAYHRDVWMRADRLVVLAAAGVPIVADEDLTSIPIAPELQQAIAEATREDLEDPLTRELASVRQRRAALTHHSTRATWRRIAEALGLALPRPPRVSVLLATNRPQFLPHAVRQVDRQDWEDVELLLGLHGEGFDPNEVARIIEGSRVDVKAHPIDAEMSLGGALNVLVDDATGDIVTKMDDDDWYGHEHLRDLVLALEYSGASLVGKAAEFVHLEELGITIHRFAGRSERHTRTIAGGTFALGRETLRSVGNWPLVPKSVDQALLAALEEAGHRLHRTHGFGYILERRASGHTWGTSVDYFLRQSEEQWRGLASDQAGIG